LSDVAFLATLAKRFTLGFAQTSGRVKQDGMPLMACKSTYGVTLALERLCEIEEAGSSRQSAKSANSISGDARSSRMGWSKSSESALQGSYLEEDNCRWRTFADALGQLQMPKKYLPS
jgi:hypothetical protein